MSRITISDINVEMTEVSEVDAAAVVGGLSFNELVGGLASLGAQIASQKIFQFGASFSELLGAIGGV
ncbi:MAG: hypothetical protein KME28_16945 [Pelatocladus maniniholoensis HA4357-MV3]|jgi:hypothetical protein|uniref:Uncharacterized protein n=1 Tax=Pelatocladus maniniholoensis HA4357-MV3 TaxID=1117104 RepID=A0A9E3HA12_9NOST|nr:hypothetical protein [Pelatocladus maniniholoensis HA4357-MV3]